MQRPLKSLLFAFGSLLLAACGMVAYAQDLRVITEEWPPYNFQQNGKASGFAVEMTEALLAEAGIQAKVEFLPWNRAYAIALETPNVLLFTLGRNKDREPQFHWLLRVAPREMRFYALAERKDIVVSSLDDARQYTIGTGPKKDGSTQELIMAGFSKNLDIFEGEESDVTNLRKLLAKRFDIMVGNPVSITYSARKLGIDPGLIKPLFPFAYQESGYWIALSRKTDPNLLERLLAAAKRLESKGAFKEIRRRNGVDGELPAHKPPSGKPLKK